MSFWRNNFSDEEIKFVLNTFKEGREISPEGRVSIKGQTDFELWLAVLISASEFEVRTDTLRKSIIHSAIFSPELKKDFSESDFKEVCYKLRNKYQYQDIKPYKVVFPIWNKPQFLAGIKKHDDLTINFSPSKRTSTFKRIIKERQNQTNLREFSSFFLKERVRELEMCSICIVHVKANSPADAHERASKAIYEILGLANLAKDSGKYSRTSFRTAGKLPVSEVLIAPHTTTHRADGSLTHGGFWYEQWVGGPNKKNLNVKEAAVWERRYSQLANGIANSPWTEQCRIAAEQYFKAFSNPNLEESFLDGWRLFERISGPRKEDMDKKIYRASNIFEANSEYRIIGKHLGLRRNLISHGYNIKTDDEETLAFQMLQIITPLMEMYIINGFSFKSLGEFWAFLDLPCSQNKRIEERNELLGRLSLLEKAAKFRGEHE